MDRVKRIWYLSPMRAAKVQASLRIRAVSPEPPLLAHRSSESRGTLRQKARSVAPLNGWACAVKICHDGMLEDTNSLGGAQIRITLTVRSCLTRQCIFLYMYFYYRIKYCLNQRKCMRSGSQPRHKKTYLRHMRPANVQINLRIYAVWSAPLLFAAKIVYLQFLYFLFHDSN